jgi:hypothetical protein
MLRLVMQWQVATRQSEGIRLGIDRQLSQIQLIDGFTKQTDVEIPQVFQILSLQALAKMHSCPCYYLSALT